MSLVLLYVATFIIFMAVDYLGLSYLIKPLFQEHLGDALLEDTRLVPAALFYAFYLGVLVYFVSWPAINQQHSLLWVAGNAALIGAVGYGTYEFTSFAVMRDWSWSMVATDFTWGIALTAAAATAGVWITRSLT
jgi:uncharacterized membrane protein